MNVLNNDDKLAAHVAGMMLTDHSEEEVREWLQIKKGIVGEDAQKLIDHGVSKRCREVRIRALLSIIFSGLGLLLFAVFVFLQYAGEFVLVGIPVLIVWGVGLFAFVSFLRGVIRLVTGRSSRSLQ